MCTQEVLHPCGSGNPSPGKRITDKYFILNTYMALFKIITHRTAKNVYFSIFITPLHVFKTIKPNCIDVWVAAKNGFVVNGCRYQSSHPASVTSSSSSTILTSELQSCSPSQRQRPSSATYLSLEGPHQTSPWQVFCCKEMRGEKNAAIN